MDWIRPETLQAKFSASPQVFENALSQVRSEVKNPTDVFYMAVSDNEESDLYQDMMISPDAGDGRMVIGAQGEAANNAFDDVPVLSVEKEGELLFNQSDNLIGWASHCTKKITIEYHFDGSIRRVLLCRHGDGMVPFTIRLAHQEDDFEQYFISLGQRFENQELSYSEPKELNQMISRAGSHAPSGSGNVRTGDLLWKKDSVEFVTFRKGEQHSIATKQEAPIDVDLGSFEWEVSSEHLSILSSALSGDHVEIGVEEIEGRHLFKIAYQQETGDDFSYCHRQLFVQRQEDPLKDWVDSGDEELFGSEGCQLFATTTRDEFISAMKRVWELHPTTSIGVGRRRGDGRDFLTIRRDQVDAVNDQIPSTLGETGVEMYPMNPNALSILETLTQDERLFQILTYPIEGEPIPNGYVIVPLTDEDNPSEKKTDPNTYMTITWEAEQ